MKRKRIARIALAVAVVGLAIAGFTVLPAAEWALSLVEWIREAGALGMLVFASVYVLATALMLPGAVLTLGAGFAYGPLVGVLLVSPVSVLAATVSFLLARFVARDWLSAKVAKHPKFEAIDAAVGENGLKIVLLLRLSPVFPFNFLNVALGLTRVRLRDFVLGSWIGMLPGTFLYVYLGSIVTSASELLRGDRPDAGPWGQALYWGGLVATLVVTVVITRIAKRAVDAALENGASREAHA